MAQKAADLATRMAQRDELVDGILRQTLRMPVEAARAKAREIIRQAPQAGYTAVIERWWQLPDGQIELTMRRLPAAD